MNNDTDPMDDHGHGSHCAGIIAAALNNSVGVAGLAQVQIMAEKALDEDGGGTIGDLTNAIYHAVDQGAKILSISLGLYINTSALYEAIEDAYSEGVLLVAAAGNDATCAKLYPAAYDEVIAVAATNVTDDPTSFTNYGNWIELSAPGSNITSTLLNNSYGNKSGTSMACPHVAGVAALIWSQFPNMTRDFVRYQLCFTVDDLGVSGFDKTYGWGRINAREAVEEEQPEHDLGIIAWEPPYCVQPGQSIYVNTTVVNFGLSDEFNVAVELRLNDTLVDYDQVSVMESGAICVFNTSWTSSVPVTYKMDSVIVQVSGETRTSNNIATTMLTVRCPTVLYVPQNYTTIQSAIDASCPDDVIQVSNGTYYENLLVHKPRIAIIGQDNDTTVVDGNNTGGAIITISEDEVTISGFTIQNAGYGISDYCIFILSNGNNITGNTVKNGWQGIRLLASDGNQIHCNTVTQQDDCAILLYGNVNGTSISENTLADNSFGVYMYSHCTYTDIYKNNITANSWSGVFGFLGCSYNTIIENKITSSGLDGVSVIGGQGTKIKDNFLKENDDCGLFINAMTNIAVYHNTIINNTNQAWVFSSSVNWTGRWSVTGNYWSDYTGNDTNGDGIGDTPYDIYGSHKDYFPFMNPYLPGDINHDGKVDMRDIGTIARAYGTEPGDPRWNPKADLIEDAKIDMLDMNIATANFGKTWQDYWGE